MKCEKCNKETSNHNTKCGVKVCDDCFDSAINSYIVDCGLDYKSANQVMDITGAPSEASRNFTEDLSYKKAYIAIKNGVFESWDSRGYTEDDYNLYKKVKAEEFIKLFNNKQMKKENKFKKGVVTTTKEVTKKVPKPLYSTKEEYLLHIEGNFPALCTPLYAVYREKKAQWCYYFNSKMFDGTYITESELTKALI